MWFRSKDGLSPPRRIAWPAAVAAGALCAAASIGLRAALTPFLGGEERLVAMFPALLVATFYGGAAGGVSCLLLNLGAAWYLFLGRPYSFELGPHEGAGLLVLLASGAALVAGVLMMRTLIRRLHEAKEEQDLLARELQHRVKNNLAVVEALAAQSARHAETVPSFLDSFLHRLRSLSAAHTLLSRARDETAELGELVAEALSPFDFPGRIAWSGPSIRIGPDIAVALALCLHELATNAVKHGALSTAGGVVRISWAASGPGLRMEWRERDGPPVRPPERTGLGARLLRRGLDPARPASLVYAPEGLSWSADFHPLRPQV